MSDPRVIKKYPNRRLYDTVESRYITLADIRKLVVDRIDFVVIDKKTPERHHAQHPAAGDCRAGAFRRAGHEPRLPVAHHPLLRRCDCTA